MVEQAEPLPVCPWCGAAWERDAADHDWYECGSATGMSRICKCQPEDLSDCLCIPFRHVKHTVADHAHMSSCYHGTDGCTKVGPHSGDDCLNPCAGGCGRRLKPGSGSYSCAECHSRYPSAVWALDLERPESESFECPSCSMGVVTVHHWPTGGFLPVLPFLTTLLSLGG
jgi:DNA-directed RNA polymerase subunit RPC12/RpoP